MKTSKYRIPSILGVVVLVLGLAAGVMLIGQNQIFRLGASADAAPQDVRISNITDTSFTVSWTTGKNVVGYLSWGQTSSLGQLARQLDASPKRLHSVMVRDLSPGSTYFLVINSGGTEFDNNGVPWSVATGPKLAAPTGTALASGLVLNQDGSPAGRVLVYINGGAITQLSTLTSDNGTWTIPLSTARNKTLSGYATLSAESTLEIFVQGEASVSTAQARLSQVNPLANMTLGQTYDFRGETVEEVTGLPEANVNLPEDEEELTGTGGLDVSGGVSTKSSGTVTLESVDQEGEVIFTTSPEFFGEGPPNTEITITIESDPVTDEVSVASNGTWRWSVPSDLEEGEHTITIKWTDANGFLRTLTRTFVVQAAEGEPSFESTPSGSTATPSPTPSPSPSPTPKPTASATPTPTPSPAPTPTLTPTPTPTRVSIPSTESGVPAAGGLTPTLLLGSIGLLLFISGIVISKKNV